MAHIHFEEEQRFSNVPWVWIATLLLLVVPLALMAGNEEISSAHLGKIFLTTAVAFLPVVAILFYSKLEVKINKEGLHYKFFPAVLHWKVVPKEIIQSFEVTPKQNLMEKLEIGFKRNLISKSISMNITGSKFARLKLSDGRILRIGTAKGDEFERALQKLTSTQKF